MPSDLRAMTVNERLFARGLLEQFDEAVRRGDTGQMIELLAAVELGDQAAWISETILKHPNRYGRISN